MNTEYPETEKFKKLEALLEERGLEFPPTMQFQYWHDPAFKAIFCLILELFEGYAATSTWEFE